MYDNNSLEIVNKVNLALSYTDIVKLGSYEAIRTHMINQVFRSLEDQKSVKTTIKKTLSSTGASIDANLLDAAMMYLEVRHLIVHNSGIMDRKFEVSYSGKLKYAREGSRFPMTTRLAERAIDAIQKLAENIDGELISKSYLNSHPDLSIELTLLI